MHFFNVLILRLYAFGWEKSSPSTPTTSTKLYTTSCFMEHIWLPLNLIFIFNLIFNTDDGYNSHTYSQF